MLSQESLSQEVRNVRFFFSFPLWERRKKIFSRKVYRTSRGGRVKLAREISFTRRKTFSLRSLFLLNLVLFFLSSHSFFFSSFPRSNRRRADRLANRCSRQSRVDYTLRHGISGFQTTNKSSLLLVQRRFGIITSSSNLACFEMKRETKRKMEDQNLSTFPFPIFFPLCFSACVIVEWNFIRIFLVISFLPKVFTDSIVIFFQFLIQY